MVRLGDCSYALLKTDPKPTNYQGTGLPIDTLEGVTSFDLIDLCSSLLFPRSILL